MSVSFTRLSHLHVTLNQPLITARIMASLFASSGDGLASRLGLSPWVLYSAAGFTVYAVLCSSLRFQRLKTMRKRLNFPDRESLSRMTNEDAQKIVSYISTYEFPLLYDFSLRYAIFKVSSHVFRF